MRQNTFIRGNVADVSVGIHATDDGFRPGRLSSRKISESLVLVFAGKSVRDKPSTELLTVLSGSTILDTATNGTIELVVDGQRIAVRTMQ